MMKSKEAAPAIEVKNLNFQYEGVPVLENISFSIGVGEYWGLIGPNGGGKTTLLRIILGLVKPTFGEVRIFGKPIEQFKLRSIIGYIPQKITQNEFSFPATVEEVISTGRIARIGMLRGFERSDERAIEKALQIAGIKHIREERIGNLSGGQLQRVYIARALASEPKILILDEPTVGVDISAQEKFYAFIADLNKTFGLTILFVSHDLDVIANEVNSVLCLNRTLICHGPAAESIQHEKLQKLYGHTVHVIKHHHA